MHNKDIVSNECIWVIMWENYADVYYIYLFVGLWIDFSLAEDGS